MTTTAMSAATGFEQCAMVEKEARCVTCGRESRRWRMSSVAPLAKVRCMSYKPPRVSPEPIGSRSIVRSFSVAIRYSENQSVAADRHLMQNIRGAVRLSSTSGTKRWPPRRAESFEAETPYLIWPSARLAMNSLACLTLRILASHAVSFL